MARPERRPTAAPPRLGPSYIRALIRGRGGAAEPGPLPEAQTAVAQVRADPERLAAYARVCGIASMSGAQGDRLPPAYPHVLAFPAALELMTRSSFPLPLLGLVHVANRISVLRPIGVREGLSLRLHAADVRPHPAGLAFDLVTCADDHDGEPVWESSSTYLYRPRGAARDRPRRQPKSLSSVVPEFSAAAVGDTAQWHVSADTGRRYAAASGDRNPIHLYPWTARPFGFRSAIAHGMWVKARVLAALEPALPAAYTVEVAFRAPVPLPCTVRFISGLIAADESVAFALTAADGARVHLDGTVRALPGKLTHR